MGDGVVRKHAIIINGDTEARHLANVTRAAKVLKRGGYELHVASPQKPGVQVAGYVYPTLAKVKKLIAGVKSRIDDDDVLVIYGTGHGGDGEELCLRDGCIRNPLVKQLDSLKYGKRVIAFDSCFGGNLSSFFTDNPKTLFVSAGVKGKTVCCGDFSPMFWKGAAVLKKLGWDLNKDGVISWQERFAAAYKGHHDEARVFLQSKGFRDFDVERGGRARSPFPSHVVEVNSYSAFDKQLKKLKPGQFAVVCFSSPSCWGCVKYKPVFNSMARSAGGSYLFLRTNSEQVLKRYGITSVPRVIIVDSFGSIYEVKNRTRVLAELAAQQAPILQSSIAYIKNYGTRRGGTDTRRVIHSLNSIAQYAGHLGMWQMDKLSVLLCRLFTWDSNKEIREAAARAMSSMMDGVVIIPRVVPYAVRALYDKHAEVRVYASKMLKRIADPKAARFLPGALNDADARVRRNVAETFAKIAYKRAVPRLIQLLRDKNIDVRIAAAKGLVGNADRRVLKPFIALLESRHAALREQAALGLEIIPDASAVPPLISAASDADASVRLAAARALGPNKDPRAVPVLITMLKDQYADIREAAASALGWMRNRQAVTPLIYALRKGHDALRLEAALSLGSIKDRRAFRPLLRAMGDRDETVRTGAVEALGALGDIRATPYILAAMKRARGNVRYACLKVLGILKDRRAVGALIRELKSTDAHCRELAAFGLGMIGDKQATPPLIACALAHVDSACMWALRKIKDPRARRTLVRSMGSAKTTVRLNSAWALGELADRRAVKDLLRATKDGESAVRMAVALALGKLKHRVAVPALLGMLKDADGMVRANAAWALGNIGDRRTKVLVGLVSMLVTDTEVSPRESAARSLGMLGDKRTARALRMALRDKVASVRYRALGALSRIKGLYAADAIIEAAQDNDYLVRREALKIMKKKVANPVMAKAMILAIDTDNYWRESDERAATLYNILTSDRAFSSLIVLLRDTSNVEIPRASAFLLGKLGDRKAIPHLMRAMNTNKWAKVREYAIWALGEMGAKSAVRALIKKLADGNADVREEAVTSLGKIGDRTAVPQIILRLQFDRSWKVRDIAAQVLGWFGDRRAVPALKAALGDKELFVRHTARDALLEIKKRLAKRAKRP